MRRILLALALLFVVGLVTALAIHRHVERVATTAIEPGSTAKLRVEIPKGATLAKIGEQLSQLGLIKSARVWRVYWRLHPPPEAKAGRHDLTRGMNMPELLAALAGPPIPDDIPITIVEGWRIRDIDETLSSQGHFPAGAYRAQASRLGELKVPFTLTATSLEGYVYPETFMVPKASPIDVRLLIERQLEKFGAAFAQPYADEIAKSGRSLHQLVIMASLLEREEPKPEVRPKVAGVLWKRIDKGWPLGVDATSRYTLPDWNDRKAFLKQLRDPNDPYNTRLKAGLPPGPIGAPSLPSLLAALRPEPSEYWYYLHDSTQTIHFGKDSAEHEANRKKYDVY